MKSSPKRSRYVVSASFFFPLPFSPSEAVFVLLGFETRPVEAAHPIFGWLANPTLRLVGSIRHARRRCVPPAKSHRLSTAQLRKSGGRVTLLFFARTPSSTPASRDKPSSATPSGAARIFDCPIEFAASKGFHTSVLQGEIPSTKGTSTYMNIIILNSSRGSSCTLKVRLKGILRVNF